ncbi:MAG: leucine--tRNA ligase [Candidatus Aenigmatarchaeota archaeon]
MVISIGNVRKIEKKWQAEWERAKVFEANVDESRKKFFLTFPYPYVNGTAHIGHSFSFFRVDSFARFKRMQGFNVLYPQGFHATGEPILGTIERLKEGDETQKETFKLYGASDKDIQAFIEKGPVFVAKYWMKKWIEILKLAGCSIDWRRTFITTTITPQYSRFIEWQYNTLREKGYVVQGTHPVIWCPKCQSPTGDHDRLKGEGESPIDYILIKFKLDSGEILPCGTLRPETTYGVTNLWINPEAEYVWAKVNGETWLLSKEAVEKLKDQLKKVEVLSSVKGSELVGKYVENPVTKDKVIVLPASFVDPDAATGIVMSVPSHAPYDWIGLLDLQRNPEEVKKYGIDPEIVFNIKPISLIKTPGLEDHPAIEFCEKLGVENQKDREKLDEATSQVYKKEFHLGVLKENCGEYAGMKVSDCKEKLSREFIERGIADVMWESTGLVICRCGNKNHVKILENQWFLKYSDEGWKEKVRQCIKSMKFYPEEIRSQFLNTVDWLKDKACTRRTGLGTPLPWDKSWIIETLSDSVIYMAYYTIAKVINEKQVSAEKLTDEVFDYIFLSKGNLEDVSKKSGLEKEVIEEMKREFEYFYPVDFRGSGKDLVQNHLTFYLFHHVAIWEDSKYWPKAIGVNGFVNVEGTKMSKSKGNIIPLKDLVNKIGSDLVRINIIASAENLDDANWRDETVATYASKIKFISKLVKNLKKAKREDVKKIDLLMQSKIQQHVKKTTEAYEELKFRTAVQAALFEFTNDLKEYIERCGGIKNCNKQIISEAVNILIKLLAPVLPHIAEELWSLLGNSGFVCVAKWPEFDENKVDKTVVELEQNFKKLTEDISQVKKLAGEKEKAYFYFATEKEMEYFEELKRYLKKKFGFKKIFAFKAYDERRYDPQNKAAKAKYGKPGIYLE